MWPSCRSIVLPLQKQPWSVLTVYSPLAKALLASQLLIMHDATAKHML